MILISHRGNLAGPMVEMENKPIYIDSALKQGYDVEIDIWELKDELYLGHDMPQYRIDKDWLDDRSMKLWIHCKNIQAVEYFNQKKNDYYNYFWHQNDDLVLTSKKFIWAYPGKQPIKGSIAVLPEITDDDISKSVGICSDFISNYKIRIVSIFG
jgi:hypothetical protein